MKEIILLTMIFLNLYSSFCSGAQDIPEKQAINSEKVVNINSASLDQETLPKEQNNIEINQSVNSVDSILSGIHRTDPWSGVIVDGSVFVALTLDQAIERTMQYNPFIEESRLQWVLGLRKVDSARGNFEPDLVGSYNRNGVNRENSTLELLEQSGSKFFSSQSNDFNGALEGKLFSGANYNVGLTVSEVKSNLISGQDYKTFTGATVKQPLLKGAWFGAPFSDLKAAERDRSIAFHTYRKQVMKTITEISIIYWNLVIGQEQYRIAEDSVAISQKLVKDCQQRVKAGKMSELELLEAEAGLAESESLLAEEREKLVDIMKQLKILLFIDSKDDNNWFVARENFDGIVCENKEALAGKRQTFLHQADIAHPDIVIEREKLKREEVLLSYQKDQRLVELNAKGSYGVNGLGKTYKKSFNALDYKKTPSWSVGVEMRIPLFDGVTEKNELAAARLKVRMANQRLKAAQLEVFCSVNAMFLRLEALEKRVESARNIIEFKKKRLDTEFIRFKEGKSNSRLIWEIQQEYTSARKEQMQVILKYKETLFELFFYSGSVLQERGLEIIEENKVLLSKN